MTYKHAAIWIDPTEAKIFHIEPDGFDITKIRAPHHHLKRQLDERGRHAGAHFFREIAAALDGAESILVVGPSSVKLDFVRYVDKHDESLSKKIVGLETLDHITNAQLTVYVRHYFQDREQLNAARS
jgi:stalled ribosome rescue protein Dom34